MLLSQEALSERNYEGNRLIEVTDETIISLHKELNDLQAEANPFLKKMEEFTPLMDPSYTKIGELQREIDKIKLDMKPHVDAYNEELKKVEEIDQRAQLIKNKIQPLANNFAKEVGDLKEFEIANQILVKDDKLFVEVIDKLETFIKSYRQQNAK